MITKKVSILGYILVAIGVCTVVYSTYTHLSSEAKLATELGSRSRVADRSISNSSATSDMKIPEVTSNYSVIEIPFLKIKAPITEGMGENLEYSVGHFEKTPKLSENGNICLAGHSSSIYSCIFNNLNQVETGDSILIYDENGKKYDYTVIACKEVTPDSLNVLNDYKDNRLTIRTCAESGTRRLCIVAKVMPEKDRQGFQSRTMTKRIKTANVEFDKYKDSLSEVIYSLNPISDLDTVKFNVPISSTPSIGYTAELNRKQ